MNFKDTRIIVVDDKRDEVKQLLKLFDKKGIPFNYYFEDGKYTNLPDNQLKNIRFIFLDFVLGTDGQPVKTKIATLLNVLKRILHPDNGPYIILAWTAHNSVNRNDNLLTPFKSEILKNSDIPKPVAIIDLDKVNIMRKLNHIEKKLKEKFKGKDIFEILFGWECNGRVALADVLKTLTDLSAKNIIIPTSLDRYSTLLRDAVEKNMYQFAASVSGKNLNSGKNILIDAQLPLSGIFQDHLETSIRKTTPDLLRLSRKIFRSRNSSRYNDSERAEMNTYFLLVSNSLESSLKPGNIYKATSVLRKVHRNSKVILKKKDFYDKNKLKSRRANPGFNTKLKELNKKVVPVLIEVTPECDYVQKNWRNARFIFGVLWPHKFSDNTDTKDYFTKADKKLFSPILIKYKGSIHFLAFHSDYQLTLPLSILKSIKPIIRARKELLVDIQHWSAMHASRPGKTEF